MLVSRSLLNSTVLMLMLMITMVLSLMTLLLTDMKTLMITSPIMTMMNKDIVTRATLEYSDDSIGLTWHASARANPPPSRKTAPHGSFVPTVGQSNRAGTRVALSANHPHNKTTVLVLRKHTFLNVYRQRLH